MFPYTPAPASESWKCPATLYAWRRSSTVLVTSSYLPPCSSAFPLGVSAAMFMPLPRPTEPIESPCQGAATVQPASNAAMVVGRVCLQTGCGDYMMTAGNGRYLGKGGTLDSRAGNRRYGALPTTSPGQAAARGVPLIGGRCSAGRVPIPGPELAQWSPLPASRGGILSRHAVSAPGRWAALLLCPTLQGRGCWAFHLGDLPRFWVASPNSHGQWFPVLRPGPHCMSMSSPSACSWSRVRSESEKFRGGMDKSAPPPPAWPVWPRMDRGF